MKTSVSSVLPMTRPEPTEFPKKIFPKSTTSSPTLPFRGWVYTFAISSPNTIASAWKSTTALSFPPIFARVWAIPFCLQVSYRTRRSPQAFALFPFSILHRLKSTRTALCDATVPFRPIGKTSFFTINPKQKSRSYMSGFSLSY